MMIEAVLLVAGGILVGASICWFLSSSRARAAQGKQMAEVRRRASLAEILRDELYAQNERKDRELADLRKHMENEQAKAAEAVSQRQAAHQKMTENQHYLDSTIGSFTNRLTAMNVTVADMINQSHEELAHFKEVGKFLESATEAHNKVIAAMEARLTAASRTSEEAAKAVQQQAGTKTGVPSSRMKEEVVVGDQPRVEDELPPVPVPVLEESVPKNRYAIQEPAARLRWFRR
jgi:chromosome segregation ATPase